MTAKRNAPTIHTALTPRQISTFQRHVWAHYQKAGRQLPWRGAVGAYRILVSEVMLQQTQVDRVIPKYKAFVRQFPSVRALSRAPLCDVLLAWQGLGYNRRARLLHECAKTIMREHRGVVPRAKDELEALPGVGPYTAAAVRAFAYHEPTVLIETNIRTVYIHHFFPRRGAVSDRELAPLIAETLDRANPGEWYHALMDYGAMIKRTAGNASRKSAHYAKQSRFEGSTRQLRGAIIRLLVEESKLPPRAIARHTKRRMGEVQQQLERLSDEGLVMRRGGVFTLVS